MKRFAIFNDDGRVISEQLQADSLSPPENGVEIENSLDGEFYIEEGELKTCLDFELSNLPLPCVLTIEGERYECSEQPELSFDAPGNYVIHVEAGPSYRKKVFEYAYYP
ncbi:hypothetical protein [Marinobacterium litorale]|uniref:hypothetical protein n=1 Tax=Marinobacterium litorale TaxID=404770 RepID=UPI0012EC2CD6|nr:hypothetical protein [Marinobacterium litorale]